MINGMASTPPGTRRLTAEERRPTSTAISTWIFDAGSAFAGEETDLLAAVICDLGPRADTLELQEAAKAAGMGIDFASGNAVARTTYGNARQLGAKVT